jgi:hypothetical protein
LITPSHSILSGCNTRFKHMFNLRRESSKIN